MIYVHDRKSGDKLIFYRQLHCSFCPCQINVMMAESPLASLYVNTDVLRMTDLHPGMQVQTLMHVRENRFHPMAAEVVLDYILKQLRKWVFLSSKSS